MSVPRSPIGQPCCATRLYQSPRAASADVVRISSSRVSICVLSPGTSGTPDCSRRFSLGQGRRSPPRTWSARSERDELFRCGGVTKTRLRRTEGPFSLLGWRSAHDRVSGLQDARRRVMSLAAESVGVTPSQLELAAKRRKTLELETELVSHIGPGSNSSAEQARRAVVSDLYLSPTAAVRQSGRSWRNSLSALTSFLLS